MKSVSIIVSRETKAQLDEIKHTTESSSLNETIVLLLRIYKGQYK